MALSVVHCTDAHNETVAAFLIPQTTLTPSTDFCLEVWIVRSSIDHKSQVKGEHLQEDDGARIFKHRIKKMIRASTLVPIIKIKISCHIIKLKISFLRVTYLNRMKLSK
jgi:hypothetical protein